MANSITQHPPSALAFPMASRPSALGFGFGTPTRSPLASVNFGQWASPSPSPAVAGPSASPLPLKAHPRPSPYPTSASRTASNLKRGRRSSSPPPSPTPSSSSTPNLRRSQTEGREEMGNRRMKKLRQDPKVEELSSQVDVGMMLASLPPNAYLQMFLSMLKSDPSLGATILEHMPRPELSSCLLELDRAMERFEKQFGPPGRHPMSWTRSESMVLDFCRLATSYIHFFNTPSPKSPPADLGTLHALLYSVTRHILSLLRLAPPTIDNSEATASVSALANLVIAKWTQWVDALVTSVGQAEMYPQSTVAAWAANFDAIIQGGNDGHAAAFARELAPAKERFENELGWMMGPRRW